jgi:hypothetical protein
VKAWVCRNVPSLKRCVVRIPLPQAKPVEILPVPEVEPAPLPPPPVLVWPEPPKFEAPPVSTPPPQAAPDLPKTQPSFDKRSGAEPPKQADRSKLRERNEQAERRRRAVEQETQRQRELATGFCFFPITCAKVCEYARAGDNRRGTPCQNARGLACIRSTCPEVLNRKR